MIDTALHARQEGRPIVKKDDARCRYCLTILAAWPQELSWQVIEWPYAMRKIGSNDA
jgi:hypothetical protein